jgi:toxin secretion/phage lysis holin
MDNAETKGVLGCITGVAMYMYNSINEIVIVLTLLMIFDYVTGISLALKDGNFNPKKGAWGAVNKLMYGIVICLGFLLDFTSSYLLKSAHISISTQGTIGIVVVCYLIANEGLSITKNLVNLGLPVPPILAKTFGIIKDVKDQKEGVNDA